MRPSQATGARAKSILLGAVLSAAAPGAARAHIKMTAPADWLVTNADGDPQKIPPCGVDSTVTYTPTNTVTTVHVGDKVTVNWTETVPHDGHFRIALAINSRSELTDPAVTQMNSDGTAAAVAISTSYPVLADNLFPHTAASISPGKTYSYTVTIPNTPCTKCTLQLLQFMANHPLDPSYFYHHCADFQILAAGASGGSGGGGGSAAIGGHAGTGSGGTTGSGGATATGGTTGSGGATATGGTTGSGGAAATGGTTGNGGTTGSGGATATGGNGVPGSGGAAGSGGTTASGGTTGSGGATGAGGATGTGGAAAERGTGGCSCAASGGGDPAGLGALVCLALLVRRRGRRHPR